MNRSIFVSVLLASLLLPASAVFAKESGSRPTSQATTTRSVGGSNKGNLSSPSALKNKLKNEDSSATSTENKGDKNKTRDNASSTENKSERNALGKASSTPP